MSSILLKSISLLLAFTFSFAISACNQPDSSSQKEFGLSKSFVHVDDQSASKQIYQSEKPVFIYFYAKWCLPCKILNPRLNKLAALYGDKISFVEIDVEEAPNLAEKYKIENLPRMQIHSKKCLDEKYIEGVKSEKVLKSFIDETLPECI